MEHIDLLTAVVVSVWVYLPPFRRYVQHLYRSFYVWLLMERPHATRPNKHATKINMQILNAMPRQTEVTCYLKSKQLLWFVFVWQHNFQL